MRIQQITNPLYLGYLAPNIKTFVEKINPIGVSYESLYTYFQQSIQFGMGKSEFWVVYDEKELAAFAHWLVMSLPHIGKVCCDHIYSWNRKKEPVEMLLKQFIEFGKKNRCPLYAGYAINEILFRVWRKAANKFEMNVEKLEIVSFVGRNK